jgi:hypothetical protein
LLLILSDVQFVFSLFSHVMKAGTEWFNSFFYISYNASISWSQLISNFVFLYCNIYTFYWFVENIFSWDILIRNGMMYFLDYFNSILQQFLMLIWYLYWYRMSSPNLPLVACTWLWYFVPA